MPTAPVLLARGPWDPGQIDVSWRSEQFEPDAESTAAADTVIDELRQRGSPSHDGLAGRLVSFDADPSRLKLELQPARWALRLIPQDAAQSFSVVCLVRSADGRWLAGLRAGWLASWAGRWGLGAAGSVEVDENPTETMRRELEEEWSVAPERLQVEALVRLPSLVVHLVGQAWLPEGAAVTPDHEHDDYAWWPPDPREWPDQAEEPLRRLAIALTAGA